MPAGDSGGYFQNLPIIARAFATGQILAAGGSAFRAWMDFLPRDNRPTRRMLSKLVRGATGTTVSGAFSIRRGTGAGTERRRHPSGIRSGAGGEYVAIGAHNDDIGYDHEPVDHDSLRALNAVVRPGGEDDPPRVATPEEMLRVPAILDSLRRIRQPRRDSIYNGADHDGSGSVAVLEIAEALARAPTRPKRSVLSAGMPIGFDRTWHLPARQLLTFEAIAASLFMMATVLASRLSLSV